LSLINALKFKIGRLLVALKVKRERYSWFIASDKLNQGYAVFKPSKNKKLTYKQWEENQEEEKEIEELVSTINEYLEVCKTTNEYKAFVAKHYEKQGYTTWEYAKDRGLESDRLDLVLKKSKNILLVECRNCSQNIDMEQILYFEKQAEKFLEENQIFRNYTIKLRYTMSSLLLEEEAYSYIKSNSDRIDYDIVKLKITPKS
jgi:hypothetical protein